MKSFPNLVRVMMVIVVASLLASCGPAAPDPTATPIDEPVETPVDEPIETPVDEPEATPEPEPDPDVVENVLVYAYPRTIGQLDPSLILSSECNLSWNVWGNLTLWDPDEGIQPMLASDWESNEDATEWTFYLHQDAKCHDGTDLTADDVKFSFERTIDVGALAYVFAPVDSMEVVDEKTIKFHMHYPTPADYLFANNWGTAIMCRGVEDKPAEWFAEGNAIGAGPYMLESYEPGTRLTLTKFEDWIGGWEENSFDTVIMELVEDPTVRMAMLRAGEADLAWGIPFDDFDALEAAPGVKPIAIPAFQNLQYHFNMKRPPLDDLRVRQALLHAFPYDDAAQGTYAGFGVPAEGAVPRTMWDPPVETQVYNHDLERARELLDDAGVQELDLLLGVEVNAPDATMAAQLWQGELAQLGINLRIQEISSPRRWDEVYTPDTEFDIMYIHMYIGYDSPNEYLGSLWHSEWTWYPFSGYESQEFNDLIEEALSLEAVDRDESDRLYQAGEQLLYDEAVALFALDLPQDWAISEDVAGFKPNPLYGYSAFLWQLTREQ